MNVFNKYAEYYDLLYSDKNYTKETDFIVKILKKYCPSAKHLLELGCGTGRHSVKLAEKGYRVDGIDRSNEMLKAFRHRIRGMKNNQQHCLTVSQQDIRSFSTGRSYDAVLSIFHVISYITENMDLLKTFRRISEHIEKGIFIFDCWYGPAVLSCKPEARVKEIKNNGIAITRIAKPVLHADSNIVDVHYHTIIKHSASAKIDEIREVHSMRYFFTPEIKYYLEQSGFRLVEHGEWMTGNEPSVDTWSVYFVAEKINRNLKVSHSLLSKKTGG